MFDLLLDIIFTWLISNNIHPSWDELKISISKGRIGTMTTEELQGEINRICSFLGWKLPKLAEILYVEINDDEVNYDDESCINKFYEKLKGQLKRRSTPSDLLENYLRIISMHPEFKKHNLVLPVFMPQGNLSKNMLDGMKSI